MCVVLRRVLGRHGGGGGNPHKHAPRERKEERTTLGRKGTLKRNATEGPLKAGALEKY